MAPGSAKSQAVPMNDGALGQLGAWMGGWQGEAAETPRARLSRGPRDSGGALRLLPPIVAAVSDAGVDAVYVVAGSAPKESTNFILSQLRAPAARRVPVHVVFVTGQARLELGALSIYHIIAKETKGLFRVAYFDLNGELVEVPCCKFIRFRSQLSLNVRSWMRRATLGT